MVRQANLLMLTLAMTAGGVASTCPKEGPTAASSTCSTPTTAGAGADDDEYQTPSLSLLQTGLGLSGTVQQENDPIQHEPICMHGHQVPELYLLGPQKAGSSTVAADMELGGVEISMVHGVGKANSRATPKEIYSFNNHCRWFSAHADGSGTCDVMTEADEVAWASEFCNECHWTGVFYPTLADFTPINLRLAGLPNLMANLYHEQKSKLKFVILLRNPLERMQSGYYHFQDQENLAGDFRTWVQHVITRAEKSKAKGWSDGIEREYYMDQFLQSLISFHLKSWLEFFEPSQFQLVPMKEYFTNVSFRRETLSDMKRNWGIKVEPSNIKTLEYKNSRSHPTLLEENVEPLIQELNYKFFGPEHHSLVKLLAETMPKGLTLSGYTGRPDSAQEIGQFLEGMDYPVSLGAQPPQAHDNQDHSSAH